MELKNTEYKPEYAGKLNFYLSAVDDLIKTESDNPTINPSATTKWRVLKNNGGQLDIISAESVGNISLENKNGYMNCVYILNEICQSYINSVYVTAARCPGYRWNSYSIVNEPTYQDTGYPYGDDCYTTDAKIIKDSGLNGEKMWLCSRFQDKSDNTYNYFGIRYLNETGTVVNQRVGQIYWNDSSWDEYSRGTIYTYTLRPIVSLKSEIKITGGSGTADDPYTISI